MELTTFGAVLRFAIELEAEGERRYSEAARVAEGQAKEVLTSLARAKRKRRQLLERARQENVAEMILESIRDLDGDNYRVAEAGAGHGDVLERLAAFEAKCGSFYRDAGGRIGLAEVARIFERLARENAEQRERVLVLG